MTDEITQLRKENKKLHRTIEQLDKTAGILVRRDLELRRANEKLNSFDDDKSEFVATAAHQMRTPLSALRWTLQMIVAEEVGPLTDEQKTLLKKSQTSVDRLVRLVNNLLDADHLQLRSERREQNPVDLTTVVESVLSALQAQADTASVTIAYEPPADDVPIILASQERIYDIVYNLVDNAIKYTPADGTVTISVFVDANRIHCQISDTGIGIPEAYKSKLFTRFARADNARRVDADGSGLGLYIVKKIVEYYDGTIDVTSSEGDGTTFDVSFSIKTK